MLKYLIFIIVVTFSGAFAQGQTQQPNHQIGVSGSTISGFGISYHYILSEDYRVKLTGLYYFEGASRTEYDYDVTRVSFGIEGQKSLFKTSKTRLYGFLGIGYNLKKESDSYGSMYSYPGEINLYSGGMGVGFEILAAGHIAFGLNAGLVYSFEERRLTSSLFGTSYHSEVGFGFGGGLNFGYQF